MERQACVDRMIGGSLMRIAMSHECAATGKWRGRLGVMPPRVKQLKTWKRREDKAAG